MLLAVMVGAYACGTAGALLELAYTRAFADTAGRSLIEVVNTTSYTTAPWVEELVKVSPLLLAGLYAKVRRQWGLSDFTVLGAALGAGFGLLEALLRYPLDVDRSLVRYGGWLVPDSLSPPYIPGPAGVFTSWLPAPAATLDLGPTGDVTVATFSHLAWTAVAGLAVGFLCRARGWWKPLAVVPFAAAVAHHTLTNYVIRHPGGHPERWLNSLDSKLWAAPLVALLLAMTADWACLHRAKSSLPGILLKQERAAGDSAAALVRYATWCFPWTMLIALRFVRLRRALCYETGATPPHTIEPLRREVAGIADCIDATDHERAWRRPDIRSRVRAVRRMAAPCRRRLPAILIPCVLVLPSALFLGVGSFKPTAGLQKYFITGAGPKILLGFAMAALAWIAWQLTTLLRTWRRTAAHPLGEQLAIHRFRFATALASATTTTLLLWRSTGPTGPTGRAIPPAHLLNALDHFFTYLGFALLLLSLLALFPPGAGFALAGGEAVGGLAAGELLAAMRLGLAGIALMAAGAMDGGGDSGNGGSKAADSGESRGGSIDESEKAFSPKERRIAETLQSEGKNVQALKESEVDGRKTPDAVVDGVPTEFKTLDPGAAPNSVKNTLNTAKKQARDAVVDARGSGLDESGAREGLGKFLRNNPPGRMNSVRVIGDGYDVRWP
ncbi:PrsW family glutamic-type intramembrane protease [Streptomyces sp. HUAS TT20]|uniref:CdiA C-terminal domain-containing protein n=1 Tax=Streptomyces sp. HUAS TT20 TaxID=3447509 RepID=UPI0021D94B76|nr:PrsW family glutamic-type intramembrane protease [Streptomyces sp. HUAS 15-9]UXY32441.1 PrsW family glutamic-type intramembrane protease [Streptomyces sp. HUAS 15-9]